jgi:hypothetical protein
MGPIPHGILVSIPYFLPCYATYLSSFRSHIQSLPSLLSPGAERCTLAFPYRERRPGKIQGGAIPLGRCSRGKDWEARRPPADNPFALEAGGRTCLRRIPHCRSCKFKNRRDPVSLKSRRSGE